MKSVNKKKCCLMLSVVLAFCCFLTSLTTVTVDAATSWSDYDDNKNGCISSSQFKDYISDNLVVDSEKGKITIPSVGNVPYGGNLDNASNITYASGGEVYLYQKKDEGVHYSRHALTGYQVGKDKVEISLADLAEQKTFSNDLTFTGVAKDGWDSEYYDPDAEYYIAYACEYKQSENSVGFIFVIDLGSFKLGAKESWGKYTVNLGKVPAHTSTSAEMLQYIETGKAMNNVAIKPESGYVFTQSNLDTVNAKLKGTGLTASLESDGSIKISGTPVNNVDLSSFSWPVPEMANNVDLGKLPSGISTTGSLKQNGILAGNKIQDVILSAGSGYEFPENYADTLNNGILKNTGLSAEKQADGTIKVSGTPKGNIDLNKVVWPEVIVLNDKKADAKKAIDVATEEAKKYIDSLKNLTEKEKDDLKNEVDKKAKETKNEIDGATDYSKILKVQEDGQAKINNVLKQADAIDEIEAYVKKEQEAVGKLPNLTEAEKEAAKAAIRKNADDAIAAVKEKTGEAEVAKAKEDGLAAIDKESSIAQVEDKAKEIEKKIEGSILGDTEKAELKKELQKVKEEGIAGIKAGTTVGEVDAAREDALDKLKDFEEKQMMQLQKQIWKQQKKMQSDR